jgi:hypothetical protein
MNVVDRAERTPLWSEFRAGKRRRHQLKGKSLSKAISHLHRYCPLLSCRLPLPLYAFQDAAANA